MSSSGDDSVPDDSRLLRRIHPTQVIDDKNLNTKRPSSGAFDQPELSVDAEHILEQHNHDWHFSLEGYPGYSLVRVLATVAKGLELPVKHRPLQENPAHCEIHGRKTPRIAKALAKASSWVHIA